MGWVFRVGGSILGHSRGGTRPGRIWTSSSRSYLPCQAGEPDRGSQVCTGKIANVDVRSPIVGLVLLLGERGQMSPSPKKTSSGLHGATGYSGRHFGTTAFGSPARDWIGLPVSYKKKQTFLTAFIYCLSHRLKAVYIGRLNINPIFPVGFLQVLFHEKTS